MPKKKVSKKKKVVSRPRIAELPTEPTIFATQPRDHIIMVYGPPGIGKTQFMNELTDSTFFISTDRGTRYMKAMREEAFTYEEIEGIIKLLEKRKGSPLYELVTLDHLDDIAIMVENKTCDELGVKSPGDLEWGLGWKRLKVNLWGVVQRILNLNMGVGLIAHEGIKTIRTAVMDREQLMPDLSNVSKKVIIPRCDLVGYCHQKVVKKGGDRVEKRMIRTQPTSSIYAKDRTSRRRPAEGLEPLSGSLFAETFTTSTRSTKHGKKKVSKKKLARRW